MPDLPAPPCDGCPGLCCRNIGKTIESMVVFPPPIRQALGEFPYPVNPDGSCSQLTPEGRCAVYATRPMICSYDQSWNVVKDLLDFDSEYEYRLWIVAICQTLQENHHESGTD